MAWHQGRAYSQDLRDRVLDTEGSIKELAARFGVSESYVARARSRRRRFGQDTAGVQCNHVPCKLAGMEQILADQVAAANDQTLQQLCEWLQTEHGVRVVVSTLWKTLARMGISLKKRHSMPPSGKPAPR
jgi:transposase